MKLRKQPSISAANLILAGGLAALLLDKGLRQRIVGGTRGVYETGHEVLEHEVLPAVSTVAKEVKSSYERWQEDGGAEETAHKAQALIERLAREAKQGELADTASHWLDDLSGRLSHLASNVQSELERRAAEAEETLEEVQQEASKRSSRFRKNAGAELEDVQGAFMGFLGRTGDELEDRRRHMERDLSRARREAERELRRTQKHWNGAKLQQAIAKKVAPLEKEVKREFAAFEKDVLKQKRMAEKQARAAERGGNGGLVLLGLIGAAGAVLWTSSEARHAVLDGIEKVSPDARHHLERVGRSLRETVGTVWIEAPESTEPKANDKLGKAADPDKGTGNPKTGGEAPAANQESSKRENQEDNPEQDTHKES